MVEETPTASAVGKIIDEVVEEATITGIVENIWKELEEDNDMLKEMIDLRPRRERVRSGWTGGGWTTCWKV